MSTDGADARLVTSGSAGPNEPHFTLLASSNFQVLVSVFPSNLGGGDVGSDSMRSEKVRN